MAAKGEWDTSRPRVAYSSGKHKEEGNNSRESSTRKNIYGSVIPPCALLDFFLFFFGYQCFTFLFLFFFLRHLTSSRFTHSLSFFLSLFLSLPILRLYVRSFRFDSLFNLYRGIVQPIPKLTVLRSTKLDDRRKIWYRVGRGNVPGNGLALRLG